MSLRSRPGPRPAGFIEPNLPSASGLPPSGTNWIHEIKFDGFRLLARRDGPSVRLFTRNGYDWTQRFPLIRLGMAALRVRTCLIDGEAVCCEVDGVPSFELLRYRNDDGAVFLYAFDLLELDGRDLRQSPLEERRAALAKLGHVKHGVHLSDHVEAEDPIVFRHACLLGVEGIVSKRKGSPYRSGAQGERPTGSSARIRLLRQSSARPKRTGVDSPRYAFGSRRLQCVDKRGG